MKLRTFGLLILFSIGNATLFLSCKSDDSTGENLKQKQEYEITQKELTASVPELEKLHEVVFPLWHNAFPEKDFTMIKELLPQAESLFSELDKAKLPGILRDKQETWNKGKDILSSTINELKDAVSADNQEEMLQQVEAFHAAYERLVRIVNPLVPELEAFHMELYKLYHYYAPDYDIEKIKTAVKAMKERMVPLKEAKLPERLGGKQEEFEKSVNGLEKYLIDLEEMIKQELKENILESVEKVHTAYQKVEGIFN